MRTLLYAVRGSIPVWTFLGSKNHPCSIQMWTEQPKTGKHPNIKCGHGGWSVGRSDPYADICGHLLAKMDHQYLESWSPCYHSAFREEEKGSTFG